LAEAKGIAKQLYAGNDDQLRELVEATPASLNTALPADHVFATRTRRVMFADEAAVLVLSENGGVVQRIY
jgi:hypothetical protein